MSNEPSSDASGSPPTESPGSDARDPRDIVTETAFRIDRKLLGTPLASPWRRLAAILVDLVAIGVLVLFREISGGLFAMVLAWIMWRIARPGVDVHLRQAWLRGLFRIAAVITFVAGLASFGVRLLPDDTDAGDRAGYGDEPLSDVPSVVLNGDDSTRSFLRSEADSLTDELIAAAVAGDTARVEALREEAAEASTRARLRSFGERVDRLEDRLEEAQRSPGIIAFLQQLLEDLGFGFSWLALYFTAFVKLWRGHTPGKRLLGLRVVKVRGGEIGWWDAFGRFGGYAASFVTGLAGFAQVFWDPNRQGLHDRIAGTVVIRE